MKHPAEVIEEKERDLMRYAEREQWGAHTETALIGRTLVYSFATGQQASVDLPPGSRT